VYKLDHTEIAKRFGNWFVERHPVTPSSVNVFVGAAPIQAHWIELTKIKMKSNGHEESLEMSGTALEPINKFMSYLRQNERLHVAWCVGGIVGCLLLYGALQVRFFCFFVSLGEWE
jgi:hypothetical protein